MLFWIPPTGPEMPAPRTARFPLKVLLLMLTIPDRLNA